MLKISEIVKKTEDMFDLFNAHFYNNELIRPAITVMRCAMGKSGSIFTAAISTRAS